MASCDLPLSRTDVTNKCKISIMITNFIQSTGKPGLLPLVQSFEQIVDTQPQENHFLVDINLTTDLDQLPGIAEKFKYFNI